MAAWKVKFFWSDGRVSEAFAAKNRPKAIRHRKWLRKLHNEWRKKYDGHVYPRLMLLIKY